MSRGFGARETQAGFARGEGSQGVSSVSANALETIEKAKSEWAAMKGQKQDKDFFNRSAQIRKSVLRAERSILNSIEKESAKIPNSEYVVNELEKKAYNNRLTDQEKAEFVEKHGRIGDGKPGNGVLGADGVVELRDSDIAWIVNAAENFGYIAHDDSKSHILENRFAENVDDIITLGLRGGPAKGDDFEKGRLIEADASFSVENSESASSDNVRISDATVDREGIIRGFAKIGVRVTPAQALALATYVEKVYVGISRDYDEDEINDIEAQKKSDREQDRFDDERKGD